MELRIVPHQVEEVLVFDVCAVPKSENDENVFTLSKVQERSHVINHGASIVEAGNVTAAVELGRVLALDMEPDA